MLAFRVNCTLPLEKAHFVSTPNVRGTLDIVWSCMSVIFLCTWSILHLNVPVQSTPSKQKHSKYSLRRFWGQRFYRTLRRLREKVQWMLITFVFPEQILVQAWSEWHVVSSLTKRFEEYVNDNVPWTRSHIHYANMGGFHIRFTSGPEVDANHNEESFEVLSTAAADGLPSLELNMDYELNLLRSQRDAVEEQHSFRSSDNMSRQGLTSSQHQSSVSSPYAESIESLGSDESSQERISVSGRQLRDEITIHLHHWFENDQVSLQKQEEKINWLSTKIGKISWEIDSINTQVMQQAIKSVDLDNFPEGSERKNFEIRHSTWIENMYRLRGNYWVLSAYQLLLAREFGIFENLPYLSEDSLEDHNKGGSIITVFALIQILWLVLQLVVRLYRGLPSTLLEISTLAFATCSIVTYSLLIHKPQDIHTAHIIRAARHPSMEEMARIANVGPDQPLRVEHLRDPLRLPNFINHHWELNLYSQSWGHLIILTLILFSAIHSIAWNFEFPTDAEKLLWRLGSVGIIGVLLCSYVLGLLLLISDIKRSDTYGGYLVVLVLVTSLLARLYTTVEMFRSLAYQPPEVFISTWTANVPHIG